MAATIKVTRTGELTGENLDSEIERLTRDCVSVIVPTDGDMDITHYWLMFVNHQRWAYFGTPESFAKWQKEQIN